MAKHRPAPLQLVEMVFPKIFIQALVPEGDHDGVAQMLDLDAAEIGFHFRPEKDGEHVSVGMRLKTLPFGEGDANTDRFYEVDVEAFAVFELIGVEHQDEMAQYLRKASAASALLGAIREQVAVTTARGPWGALTIPLVGMDAIVGRPPKRTPESSKAAAKGSPAPSRPSTKSRQSKPASKA